MWLSSWEICTRNYARMSHVIQINNHYHSVEYPGVILCCNLRGLVITIVSMRVYSLEISTSQYESSWTWDGIVCCTTLGWLDFELPHTFHLCSPTFDIPNTIHKTNSNVQFKQQNVARILSADTINENIVDDDSCLAYRTNWKPKRQFRRRRFTVFHWL